MIRTHIPFVLILLLFSTCETVMRNTPDLQNEGRSLTIEFYANRKKQSLRSIDSLLSSQQDTTILHDVIRKIDKLCGELLSYEVQSIFSERTVDGETNTTQFVITTNCDYNKATTLETLKLIKKNQELIVDDYNAKFKIKH
jgi:hypothetical protein